MKLNEIRNNAGAHKRKTKLGRGSSSGLGKTSGRGGKGQTARSGSSIRIGFEGGQMPLIRRIPKRGFNNARHGTVYIAVNVESLNVFEDGARVDIQALRSVGLANGKGDGIKILGDGDVTKKLSVSAHAFSASANPCSVSTTVPSAPNPCATFAQSTPPNCTPYSGPSAAVAGRWAMAAWYSLMASSLRSCMWAMLPRIACRR